MKRQVFKSLHRHALVLGGERELVQFAALIAFVVGFGGQTWLSIAFAFAFWSVAIVCLRMMGKADPLMRQVFVRHIKQQPFYPARTSPWSRI